MKNLKKVLVLLLVASMCAGTLNLPVFAEEEVEEVVHDTVENTDGTVTDITTTTTTETDPITGDTTVVIQIQKDTTGTTLTGTQISGTESSKETVVTDSEGNTVISSKEEYSSTTQTYFDGSQITHGYADGSENSIETKAPNLTVDLPLTATDDPLTDENEAQEEATGNPAGTVIDQTGVLPGDSADGSYDYTTSTVITPGKVTVTNNGTTIEETIDIKNSSLEHVASETDPTADNDLFKDKTNKTGAVIPATKEDSTVKAEDMGEYEYVHLGSDNSSQFWAAYLYTTPSDEFPDETPVFVDEEGNPYYLRANHNIAAKYFVEGLYLNGEQVAETDEKFPTQRSGVFQFALYNPETGEISTTYCADLSTGAEKNYKYNIVNLEDSTYYEDAQAAMIRTVAKNGYWGTADDPATEDAEFGSLAAVQAMMSGAKDAEGNAVFTEEEIASLTDGMAMTATQYAIWTFSNKMDEVVFVNNHFSNKDDNNTLIYKGNAYKDGVYTNFKENQWWQDIPADKQDSVDLIFKLYNHLINMTPSEIPEDGQTTANTLINEDNFLKDMDITVIEKAEDHVNNQNDDDTDDAYVTDIIFSLVVEPSTENGDDLIVKVIGYDEHGVAYEAASGRIAGEAKEGENVLIPDEEGNYKFSGITITEGNKTFNITLEGIQNLDQGVYLYTSEVRDETFSQTMVGVAEGEHAVDVSMNISFELNVDDEVIAVEHQWYDEWVYETIPETEEETEEESEEEESKEEETDPPQEETDPIEEESTEESDEEKYETEVEIVVEVEEEDTIQISDEDIPLTDIPDEPVPMTNDSIAWYICSVFAAIALFVLTLCDKNKKFNA